MSIILTKLYISESDGPRLIHKLAKTICNALCFPVDNAFELSYIGSMSERSNTNHAAAGNFKASNLAESFAQTGGRSFSEWGIMRMTEDAIWLSARDTYEWAHRTGASWPCSTLSGHRVFAAFDSNGLCDLTIDGKDGDCDAHELSAIISDLSKGRFS